MFNFYAIGKTGAGKASLLETIALQDIPLGQGIGLIDPHGDLVERLVVQIPNTRKSDLIYLNVPDPDQPYGNNPLRKVPPDRIPLAASGVLEALQKLWHHEWGVYALNTSSGILFMRFLSMAKRYYRMCFVCSPTRNSEARS